MSIHEPVNILMVDDQPGKLLSYEAILGELGENLIKASSGREALEQLLKTDVAIVLMDVSMPELDGFELAHMIRQHPRFQKTAIIFISAVHLTEPDRLKGYQRGAVDYISVPISPELLRARVSLFAELHRKTQQLERLNHELHKLSGRLITMQDEERRRIARELHDGLGQELVAAKISLHRLASPNGDHGDPKAAIETAEMIDRAIQQIRSLSHLLHPPLLDEVGLLSALRWYLEGLAKRSGIETSMEVQPQEFPRLAADLETAIFRIVQEAVTNVFRHAEARNVWVSLTLQDGQVTIKVRDDGKGIPEQAAQMRPGSIGIGINGMFQRTKEFAGELQISAAHPGTIVEVVIPCKTSALQEARATA